VTKKRARLGWLWVAVPAIALAAVAWFLLRPLPLPCPEHGKVIDALSGAPIPGAVLTYSWTVYDYPMMDGAGSRSIEASVTTNANGEFELTVPPDRPGFFNTETYPPMVRADDYLPFADWINSVEYRDDCVVIKMTPETQND
jgi:hypothetical protein